MYNTFLDESSKSKELASKAYKLLPKFGLKGKLDGTTVEITSGKIERLRDFLDATPSGDGGFGTSTGSYLANSIYGVIYITYKDSIWD